jgi:hypothetical protein
MEPAPLPELTQNNNQDGLHCTVNVTKAPVVNPYANSYAKKAEKMT